VLSAAIDWNAIGAISGLVVVTTGVVGAVATRVQRWSNVHRTEVATDDRVLTALFGRDAKPPYSAIPGLVTEHAEVAKLVTVLDARVGIVEAGLARVEGAIDTLIERTEENGGGSIKDQTNALETGMAKVLDTLDEISHRLDGPR